MAVTDINFQEGEGQDFILEIAAGSLSAAQDFLTGDGEAALMSEVPLPETGSNIFIISE